jgi:hypothetical protein
MGNQDKSPGQRALMQVTATTRCGGARNVDEVWRAMGPLSLSRPCANRDHVTVGPQSSRCGWAPLTRTTSGWAGMSGIGGTP